MQDVVLAMLAKEPSHGYGLHRQLRETLGPFGEALKPGQIYVTLARLEKAGLVSGERSDGLRERPDRKIYTLTAAGQQRVAAWLTEASWPKPDLAEFHLKLAAAAVGRLADPLALVEAQRRELLRRLGDVTRAAMLQPGGTAGVLLEGITLRLQADLRWLDACERQWSGNAKERGGS